MTEACCDLQIQVPTEADIRKFMPSDLGYVQPCMSDNELQSQCAPIDPDGKVQPADDTKLQIQSEAQKHSRQLNAQLVAKKQENLTRMQDKFTAYNSQVTCPSRNKLP